MKKLLYVVALLFCSCKTFNVDRTYLDGEWTDFVANPNIGYFAGKQIKMEFKNDSFHYHFNQWSDLISRDPCTGENYNEYAAGRYIINDDKIYFKGNWADQTFRNVMTTGCFNNGNFELMYDYEIIDKNNLSLTLTNKSDIKKYPRGIKNSFVLIKQ